MVGSDSLSRLSDSTLPSLRGTLKSTRTMTRLPLTGRSSTKSFMVGAGLAAGVCSVDSRSKPPPLPIQAYSAASRSGWSAARTQDARSLPFRAPPFERPARPRVRRLRRRDKQRRVDLLQVAAGCAHAAPAAGDGRQGVGGHFAEGLLGERVEHEVHVAAVGGQRCEDAARGSEGDAIEVGDLGDVVEAEE